MSTDTSFLRRMDSLLTPVTDREWWKRYFDEKGYTVDQVTEDFLNYQGTSLALSCAGSGKTTLLSTKVLCDAALKPMDNVWLGTFLKSGAVDLQERMDALVSHPTSPCSSLPRVKVATLHAEFYSAASTLMGTRPNIISDSDDKKLLKEVLKAAGISTRMVGDFFTYLNAYQNTLRTYSAPILEDYHDSMDSILDAWISLRLSSGQVNHNDLQDYLVKRIKLEPEVVSFLGNRYDTIYLDEFQDTSLSQYIILQAYLSQGAGLVAVGDDDQTIYSWRGSDVSIITERFPKDFQPRVFQFSRNYRCPASILDSIAPSIEHNSQRFPKTLTSSKQGGEVNVVYGSQRSLGKSLLDSIVTDLNQGYSVVVLSRTNAEGLYPALQYSSDLRLNSIPFSVSPGIAEMSSARDALGVFELFLPVQPKSAVPGLLSTLFRVPQTKASAFLEWCSYRSLTPIEGIRAASEEDLNNSLPQLEMFVKSLLLDLRSVEDCSGDWLPCLDILHNNLQRYALRNTSARQRLLALLETFVGICHLQQYPTPMVAHKTLSTLWGKVKGSVDTPNTRVTFSTVHDFKGKSAQSVYVWNASEGSFPHPKGDLEEERRLFYIACTRAQNKLGLLVWDTHPSRFLNEMSLPKSTPKPFGGKL